MFTAVGCHPRDPRPIRSTAVGWNPLGRPDDDPYDDCDDPRDGHLWRQPRALPLGRGINGQAHGALAAQIRLIKRTGYASARTQISLRCDLVLLEVPVGHLARRAEGDGACGPGSIR